jgi:deazaflavin-dependent oxidoreductase (nitroreductase family)
VLAEVALEGEYPDPHGERVAIEKRRIVKPFQKRVLNPLVKALVRRRLLRGWAILETTGRKTGEPRETPVGIGLHADTVWAVAEFGRRASYVKNIEANPRVRVYVRGRWRAGTAHLLAGDDPDSRPHVLPRLNTAIVRLVGDELLTVRIDLDPLR